MGAGPATGYLQERCYSQARLLGRYCPGLLAATFVLRCQKGGQEEQYHCSKSQSTRPGHLI